jgi:hypothetical protein
MVAAEERGGCHWSRCPRRRIVGSRSDCRRWRGCRCLLGRGEDPRDLSDGYRNSF